MMPNSLTNGASRPPSTSTATFAPARACSSTSSSLPSCEPGIDADRELAGAALLDVGLHALEAGVHRVVGGERRVDVEHGLRGGGQRDAAKRERQRRTSRTCMTDFMGFLLAGRGSWWCGASAGPAATGALRKYSGRSSGDRRRSTRTRRAGAASIAADAPSASPASTRSTIASCCAMDRRRASAGSSSERKRTRSSCALTSSTARQTLGRPAIATMCWCIRSSSGDEAGVVVAGDGAGLVAQQATCSSRASAGRTRAGGERERSGTRSLRAGTGRRRPASRSIGATTVPTCGPHVK